ncbi:protein of unknown function [Bacillus velezensis]|nr:protein of unknown function [Bacillus velezensis]
MLIKKHKGIFSFVLLVYYFNIPDPALDITSDFTFDDEPMEPCNDGVQPTD